MSFKNNKKSVPLLSYAFSIVLMSLAIAGGSVPDAFMNAVKNCESGGQYHIMGGYNNAYHGAYQFSGSLVDACLRSNICQQYGVTSRSAFVNSQQAQDAYFEYYAKGLVSGLSANHCGNGNPPMSTYIGQTIPGTNIKITEWGLAMSSHLLGPCGTQNNMASIMNGGQSSVDGFGTPGSKYLVIGSSLDLSTTGPNPATNSCGNINGAGFLNGVGTDFGSASSSSPSNTSNDTSDKYKVENLPWYTGGDDMLSNERYNELFSDLTTCKAEKETKDDSK